MNIKWSFPLPSSDYSADYEFPMFAAGNEILFAAVCGRNTVLYAVDPLGGTGKELRLGSSIPVLPKAFFFIPTTKGTVFYTGDLYKYHNGEIIESLRLMDYSKVTEHLVFGDNLYVLSSGGERLLCINMDALKIKWECDVDSGPYPSGPITVFENKIACYGHGKLLFLDPECGRLLASVQIPRVSKLFCPVRLDDELIAVGYTNWSSAGILAYSTLTGKVKWKSGRKFEGPQLRCRIYKRNHKLYWVKNDRELICLNEADGSERFSVPTLPWLYTDLCFDGDKILYGTAGADGFINCVHPDTGEKLWAQPLKNGCAYYGRHNDTVMVGDYSKTVFKLNIENGEIAGQLRTPGEVVGQIAVSGDALYTVVWGNETAGPSLVKIGLE